MNAIIQCLNQTKSLTDYFLDPSKNGKIINNNIALQNKNSLQLSPIYLELIQKLNQKNNIGAYSPNNFKNIVEKMNPNLKRGKLGTYKDFLIFILDQLDKELQKPLNINNNKERRIQLKNMNIHENEALNLFLEKFKKRVSIISSIFYGVNKHSELCLSTNIKNNTLYIFDTFNSIIFLIDKYKNKFAINNNNKSLSIEDCFYFYIKDKYKTEKKETICQFCEEKCIRTFNSEIFSGPNILIIILDYGNMNIIRENIMKILINENIDISKFSSQKNINKKYTLYGVVTQIRQNNSKIVASCKNWINNKWYRFDDSHIKSIVDLKKEVLEYGIPLILFYSNENKLFIN